MAGDWIKMRSNLASDPAVMHLSATLGVDVDTVVGKLHRFWTWADAHSASGRLPKVTIEHVNEIARQKGFGQAMTEVGWLKKTSTGVIIPRFDRHMSQSAKARAGEQERKRIQRKGLEPDPEPRRCPDNVRTRERAAVSREEEKKEKGSKHASVPAASELPAERNQVIGILSAYQHQGCRLFDLRAAAAIAEHPNASLKQVTWAMARFEELCKQQKQMTSPAGYLRDLIEKKQPPSAWSTEYNRRQILRLAINDKDAMHAAGQQLTELGQRPGAFVHIQAGAVGPGGGRVAS